MRGRAERGGKSHLWENGIIGSHDGPPDDVQALAVARHQDTHVVGMLDQGQARVFRVLHVGRQHRIPQQVDTIEDDGGRSHDLHDEHVPAVCDVGPQIQGLGDTDPEVEDEGAEVQEEDYTAEPIDFRAAHISLELSGLWQAHEGPGLGFHILRGIEGCRSVLTLARRGHRIDRHNAACRSRALSIYFLRGLIVSSA